MCSQEQMEKKEYYQGVNNTYEIKYVNNSVFVSNVINPFEGLTNEAEWREVFKAQTKGDSTDILNTYLKPYLKDIDLTDSEFDLFLIFLEHSSLKHAAFLKKQAPLLKVDFHTLVLVLLLIFFLVYYFYSWMVPLSFLTRHRHHHLKIFVSKLL